jgi:hypothetical protein
MAQPDNRRLWRHLTTELPTRFLLYVFPVGIVVIVILGLIYNEIVEFVVLVLKVQCASLESIIYGEALLNILLHAVV